MFPRCIRADLSYRMGTGVQAIQPSSCRPGLDQAGFVVSCLCEHAAHCSPPFVGFATELPSDTEYVGSGELRGVIVGENVVRPEPDTEFERLDEFRSKALFVCRFGN